jgi:hypothetical protein
MAFQFYDRYVKVTTPLDLVALPEGIEWLEFQGNVLFPWYGESGNITTTVIGVLVAKMPTGWTDFGYNGLHVRNGGIWYVVHFHMQDTVDLAIVRIDQAILDLQSELVPEMDAVR